MASPDRIVAVIGPTAAGKSDLSIALAKGLGNAEIVNVDSMQVYRGMDIGTAKLPPSERGGVPHHLLDILDVTETATAAEFQAWARAAIADCHSRGVVPILVGGSALYIRAVLDKFEFPGTDSALRAKWDARLETIGAKALHAELASKDQAAAEHILPTNGRRIVRALEVIELTGKPYAATLPTLEYAFGDVTVVGLDVPRDVLDERIRIRVDRMWAAGLVDEVRTLAKRGLAEGRTARRALGYAKVLDFLDGKCSEDEARIATVNGTRKFARRQDSWFRKDPRIHWLPYDADDLVARALQVLAGT
ncbi:MAG: tRNA (adenosine(37)-N6)-dimethylallyltransferase MiaA [Propionibacteriales bacterium]|nr:tRNA (adenosine(37)-N6)-dimethylallyltransferase MiaA [Propionibacteriales bacterium]